MPLTSLISRKKNLNIFLDEPNLVLDNNLLKMGGEDIQLSGGAFNIQRININNGRLQYNQENLKITLLNFNLKSRVEGDDIFLRLESPHLKLAFPISGEDVEVAGDLKCELRRQPDGFRVSQFEWLPEGQLINLNGRVDSSGSFDLNTSFRMNPEKILLPLIREFSPDGLFQGNCRIIREDNGLIRISSNFRSPSIQSANEEFSDLKGILNWNSADSKIQIELSMEADSVQTSLNIDSAPEETSLKLSRVRAGKIAKMIDIYNDVPINGMASAGSIRIRKELIDGDIQINREDGGQANGFGASGKISFSYNIPSRAASFKSDELRTDFGHMTLEGSSITGNDSLDLTIKSTISDIGELNRFSTFYIDLDLAPWKLEGGNGVFDLDLKKRGRHLEFDSNLNWSVFTSNSVPINRLEGRVTGGETIEGEFQVYDSELTGNADLLINREGLNIQFKRVEGSTAKILKLLDLELDLSGNSSGRFTYSKPVSSSQESVSGYFESDRLDFYGVPFEQVSSDLSSNLQDIRLANLKYTFKGGSGSSNLFVDFTNRQYRIDGKIEAIDFFKISPELTGTGMVNFKGSGLFQQDPISAEFNFKDIALYQDRNFDVKGRADILTDFSDYTLKTSGEILTQESRSPFSGELKSAAGSNSGKYELDLQEINLIVPWKNNEGTIKLNGTLSSDPSGKIHSQGVANFDGRIFSFPNFPHTLNQFEGFATFNDLDFNLRSLRGTMGGGPVEASGAIQISQSKISQLWLNFSGKGLTIYPMDRTSANMDADLNLRLRNQKLVLGGNMNFNSVIWERELDEGIYLFSNPDISSAESMILDMLEFNLELNGLGENWIINSFGKLKGTFDLKLTGDPDFPVLTGTIESRSGEIYFSDKKFNLLKAKLDFNNKFFIDPKINLESESYIKNYRVKFSIRGTTNHLKPEFISSPPLPAVDVMALISLGELFKRTSSLEMRTQIGPAGLITTKLTEQLKNRAKKLIGIDILRIDPFISGLSLEGTSRLTIGKSISDDMIIVYSTNIANLRKEILYLQYQLSPTVSLIGMRNEEGRFSIDVRIRKKN